MSRSAGYHALRFALRSSRNQSQRSNMSNKTLVRSVITKYRKSLRPAASEGESGNNDRSALPSPISCQPVGNSAESADVARVVRASLPVQRTLHIVRKVTS